MADPQDTIVAPATSLGDGGIGILRLSGGRSESLLSRIFQPVRPETKLQSHHLYYGRIRTLDGETIDEVMAVVMRGPRSYTREDVVEIHCHGGRVVIGRILDLLIDAGARLAQPGEFTLRAFLNGRLDLTQAEAVIDIIRSRSEVACQVAYGQLEGRISTLVYRFRDQLADLLALVEAHIDFPEEEIPGEDRGRMINDVNRVLAEIDQLLGSFDTGRLFREGLSVLILGKPNVGKSSLLNRLLGETRAIVTEEAGTTRDTIEENFTLGGLPLRLVDTAGIRATENAIEKEGVRRAKEKAEAADLILFVVDASREFSDGDWLAFETCRTKKTLVVLNKWDLGQQQLPPEILALPQVGVSARTGAGLDQLKNAVVEIFTRHGSRESRETILLSDRRHREALLRARGSLDRFGLALKEGVFPEFQAVELRDALQALGEITGETAADEILDRIFSRFCIGK